MEYYSKRKNLSSFMEEEEEEEHMHGMSEQLELPLSPPRPSTANNTINSAAVYSLIPPPSPDSPWILSPLQTPSPTLLYHCIASLRRQEGTLYSIAASSGGHLVFTGSESRRIRAWRQPDCTERGYLCANSGHVRSIVSHGNLLFSSHKDFKVRVWNITSNSETFRAKKVITLPRKTPFFKFPRGNGKKHKDCVSCMAYYHAEGLLYTGSHDRTVKTWRISDGRCVDSFTAHEDVVNAVVVHQDNGCVFTCSSDGSVKIWRRVYAQSSHTLTMTLKFQPSPVNALAISSSTLACFLYSGSSDGYINFWEKERASGRFNHGGFLQGHRFSVLCLAAVEKLVFSGSEDTTIRVWRREEGSCFHECLAVLDAHRGPVRCLAASLEMEKVVMGFLVYSAGLDQTFKVWRVKVLPDHEQKGVCLDSRNSGDMKVNKLMEYEISPVLSPSWVEMKLQSQR